MVVDVVVEAADDRVRDIVVYAVRVDVVEIVAVSAAVAVVVVVVVVVYAGDADAVVVAAVEGTGDVVE